MAYVPVLPIHPPDLLRSAERRWAEVLAARPAREQDAIGQGAAHRGLAPDLVWLVAELAVSPFAHALQRALFAPAADAVARAADTWERGYCPACGSWPALAEVAGGHRVL